MISHNFLPCMSPKVIGTPSNFFLILGIILWTTKKYVECRKSRMVVSPFVQSLKQHRRNTTVNTMYLQLNNYPIILLQITQYAKYFAPIQICTMY